MTRRTPPDSRSRPGPIAAAVALALAALACRGSQSAPPGDPPPPPPMEGWGNATVLGSGGVLQYNFTLEPAALAQLVSTATAEKYVPATLTVSGEEVGKVGLRFKGEAGTLDPCFEKGVQVCPKVSFKVRFDAIEPGKRFQTLQKLNFHSMIDDPSLMHERLNAKLFADMGMVAPRVSHAELTINGENKGVFAVVEEIDLPFLQDRFKPGGAGNLYKEAWPTEVEPEAYDHALETNLGMRDNSAMVAFAQGLRTAKPEELSGIVNHFTDIEYLIRYLAVDRAIGNYDGFTAFYCDVVGHECSNHNFYWYQEEGKQRFWLIPWDLGDSLVLHTPLDGIPEWDNPPADCTIRYRIEGGVVMPSGCDPLFIALRGVGRQPYLAALDRLLGVWDMGALYRQIDDWAREIEGAVARDTTVPGTISWHTAVRSLKRDLLALRERVEKVRAGMALPGPFGLAVPGLTDFESATPLSFLLATSSESNVRSSAFHDLNRSRAIGGGADARLEFELHNDSNDPTAGAFSQWAMLRLPLQSPSLAGLRRIRLRMTADNIRSVRVELGSPAYADPESSERYGWQVLAGQQVDEAVLDLRDLTLPDGSHQGPVPLAQILGSVDALIISPEPRGRSDEGLLPAGKSDVGFVEIDDVSIELD